MFTYKIIDVQDRTNAIRVVLLSPEGQQLIVYSHLNLKKHLRVGFTIKFHSWNDSPFEWIDDGNGGLKGIDNKGGVESWETEKHDSSNYIPPKKSFDEDVIGRLSRGSVPKEAKANAWDSDEKLKTLARKAKDVKFLKEMGIRPDDDLNY